MRRFWKINVKIVGAVCTALIVVFMADVIYSKKNPNTGKGISSFNDCEPHRLMAAEYQGAGYADRVFINKELQINKRT